MYLLKRGNIFYESIEDLEFLILDAYGVGDAPILSSARGLGAYWTLYDAVNSIWSTDLRTAGMTGRQIDGIGLNAGLNFELSVGCIYNPNTDTPHQRKSDTLGELASADEFTMFSGIIGRYGFNNNFYV